jgi:hypothetical protein
MHGSYIGAGIGIIIGAGAGATISGGQTGAHGRQGFIN